MTLICKNKIFDYAFNSINKALPRIWMSFFDTEGAYTVVLALGVDRGGRATPQGLPSPPSMDICKGMGARLDHRERAGSDPVTFFGAKKDIHILRSSRHKR
jgi:hypothetical protein